MIPRTINGWRPFLYRRFASFITCEINLLGEHAFALDSKYQVNSLQDVFFHPFYWQIYSWLTEAPKRVVDLGAHCGHFSMLADLCVRVRFPSAEPEYLLVEPNPNLIPVIHRNLTRSNLCPKRSVVHGLVGKRTGTDTLWASPSNYLSASLERRDATEHFTAPYIDLDQLIGANAIDLLKVDIEGAEFQMVSTYQDLLKRVSKLIIEIHSSETSCRDALRRALGQTGLQLRTPTLEHSGYELAMFERP